MPLQVMARAQDRFVRNAFAITEAECAPGAAKVTVPQHT